MARKIYAVCDRRGVIEFADQVEDGMLPVARGYPRQLRAALESHARHGWQAGVLLVPGVPEASSDDDALDALMRFRDWLAGWSMARAAS